jgi:hypothetical protein
MRRRALSLLFLLAAVAPALWSADAISLKIRQIGLENVYATDNSPTLISFDARNTTMQSMPISLVVDEVSLESNSNSVTTSITLPLVLSPGEERTFRVPLNIIPQNNNKLVIYLEARDVGNLVVGRAARLVDPKTEGQVLGLICSTPELCRGIQQSILLSGSPDEQTYKSRILRMIQLSDPPSEGWAYAPANTMILAAPIARLSEDQRQALEIFVRNGGKLVLIEDQIADGVSSNPGTNPTTAKPSPADFNRMCRKAFFLELYRIRLPFGQSLRVGSGYLVRLPSITSKEFSTYFRPVGFSQSTPEETRRQFPRDAGGWGPGDFSQPAWLMKRLGTSFRFPTFLEILLWMIGYVLVVGVFNFIVLRRMGRPEWAWFTIPAIAILTSVLLYGTSARHRPRNFNLDDMVVYRMDNLSSLATADAKVRISSPRRSTVEPVIPVDWIYSPPRNLVADMFEGPLTPNFSNTAHVSGFVLDKAWETSLALRKWSFAELNFAGSHRFAGTISRDALGHLHNDTGISFKQAIVVDHSDVFLLGSFPNGETLDLAKVPRREFQKESGRSVSRLPGYPGPPFQCRKPTDSGNRAFTEAESQQMNEEWDNLGAEPFSLLELLRGWSTNGDDVFAENKAVFFGLSDQTGLVPVLRGQSPDRKSASLTIVTFGAWP